MKIFTFDTTLRDGTQGESVSLSVDDKLVIAQKLDELGIDYIEGGWPGSNPKDKEFFERANELTLHHAKLTAFGATRFAKNPVDQDRNVLALLAANTPVISIFGKSWELHTQRALGITEEENLKLIVDLIQEGGLGYMRFSVSDTAEYGDYTRGPRVVNEQTRAEMRKILSEVQSGEFARQWIEENKTGRKKFLAMREVARNQKIESVGRELREMMTFLKKKKEVGVPEEQPALAARK